jgi:hypothetical protein
MRLTAVSGGSDTAARRISARRPTVVELCAAAVFAGCLVGCSGRHQDDVAARSGSSATTAAPTSLPRPAPVTGPCDMPVLASDSSFQADATGGSVAALVFGELPPRAGTPLKVVWRVTGTGDLHVTALRPDGTSAPLDFGPEIHGGSTFHRPGDEWGTGFLFDAPGCWHLEVSRGEVSARVPIEVLPGAGTP